MRVEGTRAPSGVVRVKGQTLESYMRSSACVVCGGRLDSWDASTVCGECRGEKGAAMYRLKSRLRRAKEREGDIERVCRSCEGIAPMEEARCVSLDCPVFYSRIRHGGVVRADRVEVEEGVRALERLEW